LRTLSLTAFAFALPALSVAQRPAVIELRPGLVITHSVRIVPKTYRLSGAPITVRGDNITVDFTGATLDGRKAGAPPDVAGDTAIRIDGGRNIRIVNARIRGYKVAILARGTRGLTLRGNDVSRNWKPRLYSVVEHESLADWLSFHHNEKDEWLRFGAAIYLADVNGGMIRGNRAVQGMNGLLLVRSDSLRIEENTFSFNSGLGIGLYRSSDNTIVHNRLDYNVRGYSHRFYSRGQDSADLLLYEQSSRNVVAHNSATHGGDGVFLWAGQSTMDSGTGGANDNMFYGNDFSFSTANGIEATFSRNLFFQNRVVGNEYGVWGGYSFSSRIVGNEFRDNRTGIAIEHGQDNVISENSFTRDSTAIRLWADSIEPSDWGYPKHHDTRSRDYRISSNVFVDTRTVLNVRNTSGLDTTESITQLGDFFRVLTLSYPTSPLMARDRSAIIVDEWGPYDWRTPKLWPVAGDSTRAVPLRLAVLGPAGGGTWRVVARRGVASLGRATGRVGDTIVVTPAPDSVGDWEVTLAWGAVRFSYGRFEPAIAWSARIIPDSGPVITKEMPRLDMMWYRPPRSLAGFPAERWKLEAVGTVTLAPGSYTLRTISDDAVRVWVDGVLVIDHWTPHESAVDSAPLAGGRHELRVEYYQKDGWVELRLDIVHGTDTSTGSPGPH
jgi:parallel beta-helix repeat protein